MMKVAFPSGSGRPRVLLIIFRPQHSNFCGQRVPDLLDLAGIDVVIQDAEHGVRGIAGANNRA